MSLLEVFMRSSLIFFAAILASFGILMCASQSRADAGPATQPAEGAYAPRTGSVPVMLLPFRLIGNTTEGAWISDAVVEDLRTELLKNPAISLASRPASLPQNVDEAIQVGRLFGASYVVYGTYQYIDNRLRVTGSVLNETEGSVATALNATGDVHQLFQMEDGLAAQILHVLPVPQAELAQAPSDQTQQTGQPQQTGEAPQPSFFYTNPLPEASNYEYVPADTGPSPLPPNYEYVPAYAGYAYPPVSYVYPYGYYGGLYFGGLGYGGYGFLGNGRISIGRPFGSSSFSGGFGTFGSNGFGGGGFRGGGFRSGGFGGGGFRGGGGYRGGGGRR
jgi:TolB-like protein